MGEQSSRFVSTLLLGILFVVVYATAFFTNYFHQDAWFNNLQKPTMTPSQDIFSISWQLSYIFLALSAVFLWNNERERAHIFFLTLTNLVLALFFSLFFFVLHKPLLAFSEILLLFICALGTFLYSFKRRKLTFILLPYVLWTLFLVVWTYLIVFVKN